MTQKEELVNQLQSSIGYRNEDKDIDYDGFADFIIEDRKRIVKPLLELDAMNINRYSFSYAFCDAVNKTLKLAGIEKD